MTCDHKTATTPFCPSCGKQLVLPAVQSLKDHIQCNIDRIAFQLEAEPDSKHYSSRQKMLIKWESWRGLVEKMEKTDASE